MTQIWQIHNGDPRVRELRGGPAFELIRYNRAWSSDRVVRATQTPKMETGGEPVRALISLPANPKMIPLIEHLHRREDCAVVIDVHFPLMQPDLIVGAPGAVTFWTDRHNREVAIQALRLADAVTCPQGPWAADLVQFSPEVYILHDLDPHVASTVIEFKTELEGIWDRVLAAKQNPHRTEQHS